jgi:hydrogenase large subunit
MDRTVARVLETKKIASILKILIQNLIPGADLQQEYSIPVTAEGKVLTDTTRGALGHWINIKNSVISTYQIITPSVWNLSTRTDNAKGTAEQALIGSTIQDIDNPVEIGRIIRAFDPCVSCGTHIYKGDEYLKTIQVVV